MKGDFKVLLSYFFRGVLCAEIFFIWFFFSFFRDSNEGDYRYFFLFITIVSFFIVFECFLKKSFEIYLRKILESRRLDISFVFLIGMGAVFCFSSFQMPFLVKVYSNLNLIQIIFLLLIFPSSFIYLIFRKPILVSKNKKKSYFLSDKEIKEPEADLLGFGDKAQSFAEKIYDNHSPETLVFGLDAPWGGGKTSFLNLVRRNLDKNKIIFFTFEPLQYENKDNLFEKLVLEIAEQIKKEKFVPELGSLIGDYLKVLENSKANFSFWGLNFNFLVPKTSPNDIFKELEKVLGNFEKKLIIVIDDLDRLKFDEVKEILYGINKAFKLPNISYVLCYDTKNLEKEGCSRENIDEFLEKFVNVKYSLYFSREKLIEAFNELSKKYLQKNLSATPLVEILFKGLLSLLKIEKGSDYRHFLGSVRKIKKIINSAHLISDKGVTSLRDFDIVPQDLAHLFLIYVYYPNVFREIYQTETGKGCGCFSLLREYENSQTVYKNSEYYKGFLEECTDDQKFLLNQLFGVEEIKQRLKDKNDSWLHGNDEDKDIILASNVSKYAETNFACFNGHTYSSGGRNLEFYLQLIADNKLPEASSQYRFFLNKLNDIFTESISEVFKEEIFKPERGEGIHEQLWRVIVNAPVDKFPSQAKDKTKEIIEYALGVFPNHSFIEIENTGFRDTLHYFLIRLLDRFGWTNKNEDVSTHNSDENVIKIANNWVFEGKKSELGIVPKILANKKRGILGFNDLMMFRLLCCQDRGGDIHNLSRSLSFHADKDAPTQGSIRSIVVEEMREISQLVFKLFKERYIDQKKNIFKEIEEVSAEFLCGNYLEYIESKVSVEDFEDLVSKSKTRLEGFIIYQLSNKDIDHGVGIGFYDEERKADKHGIYKVMMDYIFDFCFNPEVDDRAYEYFLEYLLKHFTDDWDVEGGLKRDWFPAEREFTKVLNKDRLCQYWKENREKIRKAKYEERDKVIFALNYTTNYTEGLIPTYKVLDKLIDVK